MSNLFRKKDGFTLMELLVTIVTASIITLAATTILLLGLRINRQSMDTASRQTTTRILLSALEDLATEGEITRVVSNPDSWEVYGAEDNQVLFSFDSAEQKIYSGPALLADGTEGTPMMEGVYASYVTMEGKLLTFSVETEDGSYSSSVLCRMAVSTETTDNTVKEEIDSLIKHPSDGDGTQTPDDSRDIAFLRALASQYSINTEAGSLRNPGLILDSEGKSTGTYYSEWYVGSYADNPGWNAQTPWCACFISWGLMNSVEGPDAKVYFGENYKNGFASVDYFMNYLKNNDLEHEWKAAAYYEGNYKPEPGDLIFFDWKVNGIQDPQHIGAVIKADTEFVYTIEGNSTGRVAVRKYKLTDPRIIGYGVLKWKTTSN